MTCSRKLFREHRARRAKMSLESPLKNTTCTKGHLHQPWNTTGVLRIEKCESVCGFCQKETKTAANLRKHVAIHIKNEGLSLTIAEGSSGRGRLELPAGRLDREACSSKTSVVKAENSHSMAQEKASSAHNSTFSKAPQPQPADAFSPSAALLAIQQSSVVHQRNLNSSPLPPYSHSPLAPPLYAAPQLTIPPTQSYNQPGTFAPSPTYSHSTTYTQSPTYTLPSNTPTYATAPILPSTHSLLPNTPSILSSQVNGITQPLQPNPTTNVRDPYALLRQHNIRTRAAWTAIPASEGFRVLDLCKSLSAATSRTPCYNRETIFDEEWQAHMRDVHGVFLIWPETWMRRVEVLDLDPFGGDIGVCNEVIMGSG